MISTSALPGTVLRSDGLWPWTSAEGLATRRYSAGRSKARPSSKTTLRLRLSLARRISVGHRPVSTPPPSLSCPCDLTRAGHRLRSPRPTSHRYEGLLPGMWGPVSERPAPVALPLVDPFG